MLRLERSFRNIDDAFGTDTLLSGPHLVSHAQICDRGHSKAP
jgi:hypothetical protein